MAMFVYGLQAGFSLDPELVVSYKDFVVHSTEIQQKQLLAQGKMLGIIERLAFNKNWAFFPRIFSIFRNTRNLTAIF